MLSSSLSRRSAALDVDAIALVVVTARKRSGVRARGPGRSRSERPPGCFQRTTLRALTTESYSTTHCPTPCQSPPRGSAAALHFAIGPRVSLCVEVTFFVGRAQHEKRAVHPHCRVLPALPCATQRFRHTEDSRGTADWPGSDAALQGTCRWRQGKSSSWDPIDSSVGRSHPRARDGQSCAQDKGSA